jgi:hypothetical protein
MEKTQSFFLKKTVRREAKEEQRVVVCNTSRAYSCIGFSPQPFGKPVVDNFWGGNCEGQNRQTLMYVSLDHEWRKHPSPDDQTTRTMLSF